VARDVVASPSDGDWLSRLTRVVDNGPHIGWSEASRYEPRPLVDHAVEHAPRQLVGVVTGQNQVTPNALFELRQ
jgi:hypothetical protein